MRRKSSGVWVWAMMGTVGLTGGAQAATIAVGSGVNQAELWVEFSDGTLYDFTVSFGEEEGDTVSGLERAEVRQAFASPGPADAPPQAQIRPPRPVLHYDDTVIISYDIVESQDDSIRIVYDTVALTIHRPGRPTAPPVQQRNHPLAPKPTQQGVAVIHGGPLVVAAEPVGRVGVSA